MIGTMPDMKTAPCDRCEPEQMRPLVWQSVTSLGRTWRMRFLGSSSNNSFLKFWSLSFYHRNPRSDPWALLAVLDVAKNEDKAHGSAALHFGRAAPLCLVLWLADQFCMFCRVSSLSAIAGSSRSSNHFVSAYLRSSHLFYILVGNAREGAVGPTSYVQLRMSNFFCFPAFEGGGLNLQLFLSCSCTSKNAPAASFPRYLVRVCTAPFTRSELLHYESVLEFVTEHQEWALFWVDKCW